MLWNFIILYGDYDSLLILLTLSSNIVISMIAKSIELFVLGCLSPVIGIAGMMNTPFVLVVFMNCKAVIVSLMINAFLVVGSVQICYCCIENLIEVMSLPCPITNKQGAIQQYLQGFNCLLGLWMT